MTLKEKVAMEEPNNLSDFFAGGVSGCPGHYKYLNDNRAFNENCNLSSSIGCAVCWNRPFVPAEKESNLIIGDEKVEHPDTDTPKKYIPNLYYQQLEEQCQNNNEEKENEPMITMEPAKTTRKTKAQLMEEMRELRKEIDKLDKYRQYEECANELYAIMGSFTNAGFTHDEAFALMLKAMETAARK